LAERIQMGLCIQPLEPLYSLGLSVGFEDGQD
jgi:hypothetical protein